jgi:hypothetical protein
VKEEKIYLILGSHAHVPSGAAEGEFEYVYENKIRPFVLNLNRYSKIQAVLHYSGVLLNWVERTHLEIFRLIEEMVTRKQVEILSGGFYEPMFPLIPPQDRVGQIEFLTTYLRKHFGKRPLGCWIPCMAWEQNMAATLCASEMNYTFLSQDQFIQAGMQGGELFSPCITEDQGKLVTVFPVFSKLESELAEKSFSHVFIELMKKMEEDNCMSHNGALARLISVFPERIASSPEEAPDMAWNRFFEEISLCEKIVETVLPSKIIKSQKTYKKISFSDSASLSGFSPRRFLIDICEANGIYSKMIFTNVLIGQLKGDRARKQNAREELWKAQDSCLFSPGNGHLRGELRKPAYSSLLRAEQLSRESGKFVPSLIQYDFDFDGNTEYLFQDDKINCYIQPKGAGIFELDYLPKNWNYLDCGSVVYGSGESGSRHIAFADALLPPDTKVTSVENDDFQNARLCFNENYEPFAQDRNGKSCFKLPSSDINIPFNNIEITKCYTLKKFNLSVSYNLKNTGKENMEFCFFTEIDLSFAGTGEEFVRFYTVESGGKDVPVERLLDNTDNLKILDVKNEVQILIGCTKPFSGSLFHFSKDKLYQATRILHLFSVTLESGKTWTNEFSLKFSN